MVIEDSLKVGLADRYALGQELGRGGMATVYLGADLKHGRQVAIKVLRPGLSAGLGPKRFLREISVASKLTHPHILPLFDSGEAGGFLYYVMPYLEGESLKDRLAREGQLPLEESLTITKQVAAALDYAHRRGIVHRDVKPANVLLHDGEAVVADFGIALALSAASEERLTQAGCFVGTPEYMSPEQATGDSTLDARSDVYGLACVLFEMLAGEPPFTGPTAQAIIAKRFTDPVPSIRRVRNAVPEGVEQALGKALASIPADRFSTASVFAAALDAPAPEQPAARSVAVLPFVNLSADLENEYFADGVTEDVIAQLSKIRDLKVISRTSVMRFKKREEGLREIGRALGVETLLEGSVRWAGDRVRIVAQLIDAESDHHIWAETYDRHLRDIFAIQSDVALRIAGALRAELSPDERARIRKEPTENLTAYALYGLGREQIRLQSDGQLTITEQAKALHEAIGFFSEAVELDPGYALAFAAIAETYVVLSHFMSSSAEIPEAIRRAKEAVAKAETLDPNLPEAHFVRGLLAYRYDWDWETAERKLHRALQLHPGDARTRIEYATLLSSLGRSEKALLEATRAAAADPLSAAVGLLFGLVLWNGGRIREAEEQLRRTAPMYPVAWGHLLVMAAAEGLPIPDPEALRGIREAFPEEMADGLTLVVNAIGNPDLRSRALELLREHTSMFPKSSFFFWFWSSWFPFVGEMDEGIEAMRQMISAQNPMVPSFNWAFNRIYREDPRFLSILADLGLPAPSREGHSGLP